MRAITVRNIPDETHRALKMRAAANGRSTEAEVRSILEDVARPHDRLKLGTALREIFVAAGTVDLPDVRDRSPARAADFG